MARVKVRAIEQARRKRQSATDKARAKRAKSSGGRKKAATKSSGGAPGPMARKVGRGFSGVHPYTRLILDPCNAPLVDTPLPGREGSSLFRLPFRRVITIPTNTINVDGSAGSANGNCSSVMAILTPSAMATDTTNVGTFAINVCAFGSESDPVYSALSAAWNKIAFGFDPIGLSGLNSISSLLRPVAGCIKLEFYSSGVSTAAQPNTGVFIGYEGAAGRMFGRQDSGITNIQGWLGRVPLSQIALQGWSHTSVTQGIEAKVNYAASETQWQEFKQIGNPNLSTVGSPDTGDVDPASMPLSVAAVSGAQSGTQYLISGAIVYEWVPTVTLGVSALGAARPNTRSQSILDKVARQVAEYGPMLVGVASSLAVGGPTLALSDLFSRLAVKSGSSFSMSRAGRTKIKSN